MNHITLIYINLIHILIDVQLPGTVHLVGPPGSLGSFAGSGSFWVMFHPGVTR